MRDERQQDNEALTHKNGNNGAEESGMIPMGKGPAAPFPQRGAQYGKPKGAPQTATTAAAANATSNITSSASNATPSSAPGSGGGLFFESTWSNGNISAGLGERQGSLDASGGAMDAAAAAAAATTPMARWASFGRYHSQNHHPHQAQQQMESLSSRSSSLSDLNPTFGAMAAAAGHGGSSGFFGVDDLLEPSSKLKVSRSLPAALAAQKFLASGGAGGMPDLGAMAPMNQPAPPAPAPVPQQQPQQQQKMMARSQSEKIPSSRSAHRMSSASANSLLAYSAHNRSSDNFDLHSPRSSNGGGGGGNLRVNSNAQVSMHSLYKTELCRSWEETGCCRYGSKCQFAHGRSELRPIARHPKYKTEICRTFANTGACPYGMRCRFIHYVSSKDGSLKHGPGNSITGGGGGGGVDPKSVCPPVAPAAAAGGPKTLVAQATKEAPARGDQAGVDTWTSLLRGDRGDGSGSSSGSANAWASHPAAARAAAAAKENSASGEGMVKRTKSAYPRLEQRSEPAGGEHSSAIPNKRLPIFQSLSFEDRR
mmetsp:Transcript_5475/g.13283  ORF Transcript_5475/g.13283 Transcript_5475/m.13283 type:complete len:538 (-) Transcript_5475:452-2065(-)